jgi:radical SAM superfamily enzyme YgiQ (UPF0313 family)
LETTKSYQQSFSRFRDYSSTLLFSDVEGQLIEEIKKLYPNIKIMIGGPRANMLTWQDYADITIVGEAEDKLLEILKLIDELEAEQ